jgi:SAM-dependent methyltransferase
LSLRSPRPGARSNGVFRPIGFDATVVVTVLSVLSVISACGAATTSSSRPTLAPYVPTPQDVVDRMLVDAAVTSSDVVYDLGSGDGRVVITAAKKYGAHGVGIDIDPDRISESRSNARSAGVSALVEFQRGDILQADVSRATVVTLYLVSSANLKLRPILTRQLRPGARIVSHAFGMGDWQPEKVDRFKDTRGDDRVIYVWRADGTIRP